MKENEKAVTPKANVNPSLAVIPYTFFSSSEEFIHSSSGLRTFSVPTIFIFLLFQLAHPLVISENGWNDNFP